MQPLLDLFLTYYKIDIKHKQKSGGVNMKMKKIMAILLAMTLCIGGAMPVHAAPASTSQDAVTLMTTQQLSSIKGLFNAKDYATMYPDVVKVVGSSEDALWNHFITHGLSEGRALSKSFNVFAYKAAYKDLRDLFGDNLVAYYAHYAEVGQKENRTITTIQAAEKNGITVTNQKGETISQKQRTISTSTSSKKSSSSKKKSNSSSSSSKTTTTTTNTTHSHKYNIASPSDENTHIYKCSCGAIDNNSTTACKDTNNDNKCDVCGQELKLACEHDFVVKSISEAEENPDTHTVVCSKCNIEQKQSHDFGYSPAKEAGKHYIFCGKCNYESQGDCKYDYTPAENGTHKKECTICKSSISESCTYTDGTCDKCGSTEEKNTESSETENPDEGKDTKGE